MMENTINSTSKNNNLFECKKCNFKCSKRGDYNRHIKSIKHNRENTTDIKPKIHHSCNCGKTYLYRASLHNHKKKCTYVEGGNDDKDDKHDKGDKDGKDDYTKLDMNMTFGEFMKGKNSFDPELIATLVKQTNDLYKELVKMNNRSLLGNTINNIQNNNLTLNMFLNEQCKNAMNFEDFIEKIKVSREDIAHNAQVGFVNGISKILINHLDKMDLYQRPLHCTDVKRNTVYMRDNNEWTKDKDTVQRKMGSSLQKVSRECVGVLNDWKKENPEYLDPDSEFSQQCIYMLMKSMVISGGEDAGRKILHRLAQDIKISLH